VKVISLKIVLIFLLATNIFAQSAEDLIKKIQNKFNSISTLTADFTQTSNIPGSNKPVSNSGKFYFQKENMYRIEFKGMEIISDGSTIWNYNKKAKKVLVSNANDESNAFSIKNLIFDYPNQSFASLLSNEKLNGQEFRVIKLKPKSKGSNFEAIKIWCDKDNMLRKVEIIDNNNASLIFELSGIITDQKFPSNKFVFKQQAGTEVIDLR